MNEKEKSTEVPLISIVDDDLSVRRSLKRLLRSAGLRAEAFGSAEEFLSSGLVAETACLILDLCMPNMNGLQLQSRLTAADCHVPIIIMTAQENQDHRKEAMQAGALEFLKKPISKDVLMHALQYALRSPL